MAVDVAKLFAQARFCGHPLADVGEPVPAAGEPVSWAPFRTVNPA
jgi:hypothetical protein